jgi:hypothetical protein
MNNPTARTTPGITTGASAKITTSWCPTTSPPVRHAGDRTTSPALTQATITPSLSTFRIAAWVALYSEEVVGEHLRA